MSEARFWDVLLVSNMMHQIHVIAIAWAFVVLPASAQTRRASDVVVEPATLAVPGAGTVEFEFGTLNVPENRAEAKSRVIGVGFARFRAVAGAGGTPLFFLPGGPGSSFVADLKEGKSQLERIIADVARFRGVGDVVFVDQRGFSERGDVLKFKVTTPVEPLDEPASLERSIAAFANVGQAAVAEFTEKGIDLRGYTVKECADDVNDLRKALGYERIMLVGGSFGSQWSFAVMRRHPDIVSRAVLAGVEPLDCGYDMPSHVLAAVQRMWWEAEQDERLKPYLPPGGLMAAAREVVERLEREPLRVQLKGVKDSKTGAPITITLGPADFQQQVLSRGPADGPASLLAIYHRQYDAWAFAASIGRRGRTTEVPIISVLIDSSLGVTPRRRYLLETDPATRYVGQWNFARYIATADVWPTLDVGDDFRNEIVCPIPVVFVHGNWDTQTPIENTFQVAPYFPNSHVLIVERGGHGAMNQLTQSLPEVAAALLEFLKTGATATLPTRVTLPPQRFNAPNFSPPDEDLQSRQCVAARK
jgi:pimeloyl-ACP methyl ester carboxylesterase